MTGADSGIGLATAIALGRAGADVVVNYVAGANEAENVVKEIEGFGVRAYAHEADVSDEEQVTEWSRGWSRSSARSTSWWPTRASSGTRRSRR